jgi:hypothetical protein
MAFELGPALGFLRPIDFFPPRRARWEDLSSICIASKSRSLGDAMMLTTLPAKLRARYPRLAIDTYARGLNPAIFEANPHVRGVARFPRAIYGDDCNWGSGHLLQLKEQFFDLPVSEPPRPELYLSDRERAAARRYVVRRSFTDTVAELARPLIILHPWGKTWEAAAEVEFWDALVARWKHRARFWQVGMLGQGAVQGCEYYLWTTRGSSTEARRLFAITEQAQAFVGVDSGPMHVAAAFAKPSFILLPPRRPDPRGMFELRAERAHYLNFRHDPGFLYPQNEHGFAAAGTTAIDAFMERATSLPSLHAD